MGSLPISVNGKFILLVAQAETLEVILDTLLFLPRLIHQSANPAGSTFKTHPPLTASGHSLASSIAP